MGESITVYRSKSPYHKWLARLPLGEITGAEILKALGAPVWGSAAMLVNDEYQTLDLDRVYQIPDEIKPETVFKTNW